MSETNGTQNGGMLSNVTATVQDVAEKAGMVAKDAVSDVQSAVTGDKRQRDDDEPVISKPDALNDEQKQMAKEDAIAEKKEKETGKQQDGVPPTVPVNDKPEEPTTGAIVSDDRTADKAASALKDDSKDAPTPSDNLADASSRQAPADEDSANGAAADTAAVPPPAKKAKKEKKEPAAPPARARSTRSTRNTKSYAELDGPDERDGEDEDA